MAAANAHNVSVPAYGLPSFPEQTVPLASAHSSDATRVATHQCLNDDYYSSDQLSGFIFLCNGKTKPECYRYRVFGLPPGKLHDVQKIIPGAKLFLFDFERKLLYGVYEATSSGCFKLEPAAFGGKFPVQVSFKIHKDCLPVPESSFKSAIQDNYHNGKFKQELNGQQVRCLLSLFRSFTMPSSALVPPSMPNVSVPLPVPLSVDDNQFQNKPRLPHLEGHYRGGMQLQHTPAISGHSQQTDVHPQYSYHGMSVFHSHTHLSPVILHPQYAYYAEDPNAAIMTQSHAPSSSKIQQTSQFASYRAMVGGQYGHLEPQTLPVQSTSYYPTEIQQPYLLGTFASSELDRSQRDMGEVVYNGQQLDPRNMYYQSEFQQQSTNVMQQELAIQYCNPFPMAATLSAPTYPQL